MQSLYSVRTQQEAPSWKHRGQLQQILRSLLILALGLPSLQNCEKITFCSLWTIQSQVFYCSITNSLTHSPT
jgi:hypothetical protein